MGASTSSHPFLRNYRQSANPGSRLADRTVTFGYTGSDLTSVTDPRGKTTTFGYDGDESAQRGLVPAQPLPDT